MPDHVTLHGLLLPIRKGFDQAICKRPAILFEGIQSPLTGYAGGDIDFVVYRKTRKGSMPMSAAESTRGSIRR